MTFNTTSFLAGVGTMFAAVALGFAGGAMLTTSPKVEQNRLERVAASAPVASQGAAAKSEAMAVPVIPATKPEVTATAPAPDRVIAMTPAASAQTTPAPSAQPSASPQPALVRDDAASQMDSAKKVREGELRKEVELKKAERRAERRERRNRRDIEAAANAVRQIQRDGGIQEVSQREDSPRLGFFGNN
jgi:hypothetical protein